MLIQYLKTKEDCEDYQLYEDSYKLCNSYAHANTRNCKFPLLSYFEISIMLFNVIFYTYQDLCKVLKCDTKINNIDIVEKTHQDYLKLKEQHDKRSTTYFEQYYNQ